MTIRKKTAKVRAAIEAAKPAEATGVENAKTGPERLQRRFKMLEVGLHFLVDESLLWISSPFKIEAETRDDAGNWGILVSFLDRDGAIRSEIFGRELFANDYNQVRHRLAAAGLTMGADALSRKALGEYLNVVRSSARARCVSRVGWHEISGRRVFVLPNDQTFGSGKERVILQTDGRDAAPFNQGGSLKDWREKIGQFGAMNSRLAFSISTAFAGPLLALADLEGGGFNLRGSSRVGKTTALRAACSVWGGDPIQGSTAFMRSWRATANGLEGVATQFSDTLLALDELGQLDASSASDVAYLLANGSGKSRASRDGMARPAARWRVLFLSSGESGLREKDAEAKRQTKAGSEIRMIDLPADAGKGFGLFEELHGFAAADDFADALKQACRENYGTAGVAYLNFLVAKIESDPDFIDKLREKINEIANKWLAGNEAAGGQVRSVLRRFALVATAGEMATGAGITGWIEGEASGAAQSLFTAWLLARGTIGAAEDRSAIKQLGEFISRYGGSKFEIWEGRKRAQQAEPPANDETPPAERGARVVDRAGWRKYEELRGVEDDPYAPAPHAWVYYLTPDALKQALLGLDFASSLTVLREAGLITPDAAGKNSWSCRVPGIGKKVRLYRVPPSVLEFDDAGGGG